MNTKIYRRSRLYRSLFCIELQDRRERRLSRKIRRCLKKSYQLLRDRYKENYRQAMENKDYAATLEAQDGYFLFSNLLRELDAL